MKCPNCDVPLMMTERKGIEIDFCTQCRGIWLDRGELDKIIALSQEELNAPIASVSLSRAESDFKPAKSDPARQYNRERDEHRRERSRQDRNDYRDDRDKRHSREDGRDRERSRDDRYRKSYDRKKSLLHTLLDIID